MTAIKNLIDIKGISSSTHFVDFKVFERKGIEQMSRLTDWYKRQTTTVKIITIVCAALVVAALIIGIVYLIQHFSKESFSSVITNRESFTRMNKSQGNPMQSFVDDWITAELGTQ